MRHRTRYGEAWQPHHGAGVIRRDHARAWPPTGPERTDGPQGWSAGGGHSLQEWRMATSTGHAHGTFDVTLTPQSPEAGADASVPGRLTIDKQFHGDLEGRSQGQMLAVRSAVAGSAGYVAMERVAGVLRGRRGGFALQHSGTMTRGTPALSVTVVPDSGTEELTGLSGTMAIVVSEGKHSYVFDYSLDDASLDDAG